MASETINVEVCYASDAVQFLRALTVPAGTTLEQAIAASGVLGEVPGLDLATVQTGIYAKKKPLDTVLREHDRVEIYRPLIADPKHARRRRKPAA
nr:RnfH family protein [uncultured Duganella sp.]